MITRAITATQLFNMSHCSFQILKTWRAHIAVAAHGPCFLMRIMLQRRLAAGCGGCFCDHCCRRIRLYRNELAGIYFRTHA